MFVCELTASRLNYGRLLLFIWVLLLSSVSKYFTPPTSMLLRFEIYILKQKPMLPLLFKIESEHGIVAVSTSFDVLLLTVVDCFTSRWPILNTRTSNFLLIKLTHYPEWPAIRWLQNLLLRNLFFSFSYHFAFFTPHYGYVHHFTVFLALTFYVSINRCFKLSFSTLTWLRQPTVSLQS